MSRKSRSVESAAREVVDFVGTARGTLCFDGKIHADFLSAYKLFHAVLILQNSIGSDPLGAADLKLFSGEAVADIANSIYCSSFAAYKPAAMTLRSATENIMRVCLLLRGVDPRPIKNVYDLRNKFVQGGLQTHPTAAKAASELGAIYGELCLYVHSATPLHMDGRIPLQKIASHAGSKLKKIMKYVRDICSKYIQCLFSICSNLILNMYHEHQDFILDCLPPSLKREVRIL